MILRINTADNKLVEVSLIENGVEIEKLEEKNQFGSQVLLPLIEKILKIKKIEFKDLAGIEVATGPGSFVGLRIGATIASTLGFVLDLPVNGKKDHLVELKYV